MYMFKMCYSFHVVVITAFREIFIPAIALFSLEQQLRTYSKIVTHQAFVNMNVHVYR